MDIPSASAFGSTSFLYMLFAAVASFVLAAVVAASLATLTKKKAALDPEEFRSFSVSKREMISHDTVRVTFDLQTPGTILGMIVGQHITLRFTDADGKGVQRSYTPVTGDEVKGKVAFVIKIYRKNVHPKFPEGGKMSQHIESLQVGDTIDMKGPKGHLTYLGRGKFTVKQLRKPLSTRKATHFGMIAGGTGITPMLQLAQAIFRDEKDTTTKLSLLYANQSEDDILVRDYLESLAKEHPTRFKIHYTLDRPPKDWSYSSGFINADMIKEHLPAPNNDGSTQILMCGPGPMIRFACIPNLKAAGFKENSFFTY